MSESEGKYNPENDTFGDAEKAALRAARREQYGLRRDTTPPEKDKLKRLGKKEEESRKVEHLEPLDSNEKARMLELQKLQTASMNWNNEVDGLELSDLQKRYRAKGEVLPEQRTA